MKRVAIVGAGAAGICMGRYLRSNSKITNFVIYEQAKEIGGTWIYDGNIPNLKYGSSGFKELKTCSDIHSSMYRNLRTNLPKQLMEYPDFPFAEDKKSFVRHYDILEYINNYAEEFAVKDHIKFNSKVSNITPVGDGDEIKWKVTAVDDSTVSEDAYDSVVICNGHFAKADIPDIQGIENFKGSLLHSHLYRVPDRYKDKRVLVLGGSASARDIAVEISQVADSVVLSHRNETGQCNLPRNVSEQPAMRRIDANGNVVLADGNICKVDAVVFCTGYLYDMPFLDAKCGIEIKENRICHLYKQIFNVRYPSMAFVGVPSIVCPFQLFSMQARWISNVFDGQAVLPSTEVMLKDSEHEFHDKVKKGIPPKYFHRLDKGTNLEYFDVISNSGEVEPLKTVLGKMFLKVKHERETNLLTYREKEYVVVSDEDFEVIGG